MLQNYFKIAWRNLWKNKSFSIINIFCLALGITFSLLIGIYVLNAEGVNSGIRNIDNQYVIKSEWKEDNQGIPVTTLGPLAKTMKDEYPNLVENYYRFDPVVNIISVGDKHFRTQIAIGDTTLVSMYGFPLAYGNPNQAFRNNQSAVVTEDFANKFFGKTDVIDQVISIQTPADGAKHNFTITAVLKNLPLNTVSNFTNNTPYQVYLPMDGNQYFQGGDKGDNWSNIYMVNMLQLKPGVTPARLERSFATVLEKYQPAFVKGNLKIELAGMRNYYLKDNNGAIQKMLTTLSLVAGFILLLAIINFINISIGTSASRLKEIGLRKVFGGAKHQLIAQHITEALILTGTATIISLAFYETLLPVFNQLLNATLGHFWQFGLDKLLFILILIIAVGITSGIYPAFVLSSQNVVNAVKGKIDAAKGGVTLRKALLVIQFSLAIMVFISAIVVSKQVSYFFNKDLGYNKEQVMVISSLPRQWDTAGIARMERARLQLLDMPGVKSASLSYDIPDGNGGNIAAYRGNSPNSTNLAIIAADADFAKTYGLQVREGVFMKYDNTSNIQGKIVLNESAVKALGWTSAVGKNIRLGATNGQVVTVVGVVKDFHLGSMQQKVQPLIIAGLNESFTGSYRYFSVKLKTADLSNTINAIQQKCKDLFPDAGFEYSFMDDKFQAMYASELQLKKAADIATVLSLLIVFTGIFGVVAFTLTKRTKEIAVRKVLGADIKSIIYIFLKEYSVLIAISNIVAWPLAYLITSKWLENYVYRVHQNLMPYAFVCIFIFLAASILISLQCFKAAVVNPVKSLRSE